MKIWSNQQKWLFLAISFVLLVVSLFSSLTFGAAQLPAEQVIACIFNQCTDNLEQTLVWQIRLPRILAAILCGAGLAVAGAILQNTTRNPLAEPYLFGVVAGAGLGASIASIWFVNYIAIALPVAAFLGAVLAISIVMLFGISSKARRVESLILAGVAVSFMLSALSQFLLYMGDPFATNRVMFWLMGSLARVEMQDLSIITPVIFVCISLVLLFHRHLDALLLGDENAQSMGIQVNKLRLLMLAICAALTATLVAYCGGIGFVGLMIPHIVRQWFSSTSAWLIIGCCLLGGIFLIWVDVLARTLVNGQELPIGIITSILGSIFFLTLMLKKH
ncbi:iron ABC transporter permease [Catenovulum sp. 2E275]|uniref:FecCD family ABC transporter permease n=1 Tax=Catenovulum sp. 2E275 TaxID=2980497 RepID=UPI0021D0663B|nr:iron ABC transporter permease [Catenovulum sp. 2E275]MCU4674646.1 iron ABC transporter permease [Catenovulum sp. 2E275]